ncbi:hypothetical protein E2C01_020334 [Portunus trituberculatus]|uniref:Uncharacterized protein n=1 Tax=Portunus trituberculatus TaxID=210409 RepID=A0A5B7E083_PORTR|nr:hypothetical protein [Portunus trituberculatus]
MVARIFEQQDLTAENLELRQRCEKLESMVTINNDIKKTLDEIKRENSTLKGTYTNYEIALRGLEQKLDTNVERG